MNAVVKHEELADDASATTVLAVISRAARDPNVDIDKFERLMAVQERITSQQAESAFNDAMSEAQAKMGRVAANKENGQTHSWFATYGTLDKALRPIYTDSGFALSFDTGKDAPPECVRVLCYVSHKAGHSRTYHVDMPADGKGAKGGDVMTKTHAVGSGMSYGMRYLLKMIFNVAVGVDVDDDDGNASGQSNPLVDSLIENIKLSETLPQLKAVKVKIQEAALAANFNSEVISAYNAKLRELSQ